MARPRGAKVRCAQVLRRLAEEYPEVQCALGHRSPYELIVATILSAQCTDERVNMVTPAVFARYPTPGDLARADPAVLEDLIHSTGFFRQKALSLAGMAARVADCHRGEIPTEIEDLVKLPGVGRKTANVVRSVAFGLPGLPVDTHVGRLARRLRLTREENADKAEVDLNALVEPDERGNFSLRLITHGRRVCGARKPHCEACCLADICPSAEPSQKMSASRRGARGGN